MEAFAGLESKPGDRRPTMTRFQCGRYANISGPAMGRTARLMEGGSFDDTITGVDSDYFGCSLCSTDANQLIGWSGYIAKTNGLHYF